MIFGHGIDIVEVSRIQKAIEKSDSFTKKVFTEKEIAYCEARNTKIQSYAARFAAKEAFLKALGTGWSSGIAWTDIETVNDADGAPHINLFSVAKEIFDDKKCSSVYVSLSHVKETAIASVIIEKQ